MGYFYGLGDALGLQGKSEKGVAGGYASLDSTGKVPTGQLPQPSVYVHKTADQSSTDGTNLADVTGMSWTVEASGVYAVEFTIFKVTAATTTGLVLSLNGPASPTYLRYGLRHVEAVAVQSLAASAYETALVQTGTPSTTVAHVDKMYVYLVNGVNAGTLTLRMRTEVAASAATVQRGSTGKLTRLA